MSRDFRELYASLRLPFLFVLLLWCIWLYQFQSGDELLFMAMKPQHTEGLIGIIGSPLLHGDWQHLFSNSVPLLVLGSFFMYFYRLVSLQAAFWLYVLPGISLWIMGRPDSYHIGASGLVYS